MRTQTVDTNTMQQTTTSKHAANNTHNQKTNATGEFVAAILVLAGLLTFMFAPGFVLGIALGAGAVTLGKRLGGNYDFGRNESTTAPKIKRKGVV